MTNGSSTKFHHLQLQVSNTGNTITQIKISIASDGLHFQQTNTK